jgi:DNA replication and repair protein RecF
MLSLKIAEVTWIEEKTGYSPVLLLDEALAELDPDRRIDLLNRLATNGQILLSTTDLDLFSTEYVEKSTVWEVSEGRIKDS